MQQKSEFTKWLDWRRSIFWIGESEISSMMGVSQSTISRLANGYKKPTTSEIIALAYILKDEDHLYDLFRMNGYETDYCLILYRRNLYERYDESPEIFHSPANEYNDWWHYYYKRSEPM